MNTHFKSIPKSIPKPKLATRQIKEYLSGKSDLEGRLIPETPEQIGARIAKVAITTAVKKVRGKP